MAQSATRSFHWPGSALPDKAGPDGRPAAPAPSAPPPTTSGRSPRPIRQNQTASSAIRSPAAPSRTRPAPTAIDCRRRRAGSLLPWVHPWNPRCKSHRPNAPASVPARAGPGSSSAMTTLPPRPAATPAPIPRTSPPAWTHGRVPLAVHCPSPSPELAAPAATDPTARTPRPPSECPASPPPSPGCAPRTAPTRSSGPTPRAISVWATWLARAFSSP
ncbi:hypothetical protein DyAD56_23660 [Dyella sp. AD56]|nr:hypothetical protein DyAD56_23660 [Dyella sp. AD56]